MEEARAICMQAYGADAQVYKLDCKTWKATRTNGTRRRLRGEGTSRVQ